MNLENAICILAAANTVICLATVLLSYFINQLTFRNLTQSRLNNQTAAGNVVVANKLVDAFHPRSAENAS